MPTDNSNTFPDKPTCPTFMDLEGRTFGRLTVLRYAGPRGGGASWECKCLCGNISIVRRSPLIKGITVSCGCFASEVQRQWAVTHGMSYTAEYKIYISAKSRCQNSRDKGFYKYGGRGIEFRFDSFDDFIACLGERPSLNHSVDRINNNGHYEPGNVRWATAKEQSRNTRKTILLTAHGNTRPLSEWAERTGISRGTLRGRLNLGWCHECVVSIAPDGTGKCSH